MCVQQIRVSMFCSAKCVQAGEHCPQSLPPKRQYSDQLFCGFDWQQIFLCGHWNKTSVSVFSSSKENNFSGDKFCNFDQLIWCNFNRAFLRLLSNMYWERSEVSDTDTRAVSFSPRLSLLSAKLENREFNKWKFSFFPVKDVHCQPVLIICSHL